MTSGKKPSFPHALGRLFNDRDHGSPGDDGHALTLPDCLGLAEGNFVELLGDFLASRP